ncbi:MAG: fructosamine kinase family protein [Arcanobacterium sp.]
MTGNIPMPPRRFRKRGSARALAFEVAGLAELGRAAAAGGVPCTRVVGQGPGFIETELIDSGRVTRAAAREFGRKLARTHAFVDNALIDASETPTLHQVSEQAPERVFGQAPTRVFGQAPAGFGEQWHWTGFMGAADLPLVSPGSEPRSFGEFYADDRLMPYARTGFERGALNASDMQVLDKLAQRLHDGVFDSPQPELVTTDAALLHGDLWSGNVLWARTRAHADAIHHTSPFPPKPDQNPIGTLIDPACHGGHAESDLAQLTVFHQEYVEDIYAGYNETSSLADGWEERIGLHQLHILLVHVALFGSGYTAQTMRTARKYL